MTKTKNQQTVESTNALIQEIQIEVSKSDFKKAIKAHKRFCLLSKDSDRTSFGCFNFSTDGEKLYIQSTDGNSALISELDIISDFGTKGSFMLSADNVIKLSLHKSKQDILQIYATENKVLFIDTETRFVQECHTKKEIQFPDFDKVLPKNNTYSVSLSLTQIKDISSITSKTGYITLNLDPTDNTKTISIETSNTELTQHGLILPLRIVEKQV